MAKERQHVCHRLAGQGFSVLQHDRNRNGRALKMHSFPFCYDPLRLFSSQMRANYRERRGLLGTNSLFVCCFPGWLVGWLVDFVAKWQKRRSRLAFTHATHMHTCQEQEQETYQRNTREKKIKQIRAHTHIFHAHTTARRITKTTPTCQHKHMCRWLRKI